MARSGRLRSRARRSRLESPHRANWCRQSLRPWSVLQPPRSYEAREAWAALPLSLATELFFDIAGNDPAGIHKEQRASVRWPLLPGLEVHGGEPDQGEHGILDGHRRRLAVDDLG